MKSKLKYILPIAGILIVLVVMVLLLLFKKESYRVIKVSNVEGAVEVERVDVGSLDAYKGMLLQSEDSVVVQTESYLYLKLDEDKYVMFEPDSKFRIEATGNSANSKTSIYLEEGAVVNRLDRKLSEESSYEVTTPNSTMAVRGTIFRVEVRPSADGTGVDTMVSVYEGETDCSLIQPDGTVKDAVVIVNGDETVVIQNTASETFIVNDPETVDYEELERKVLEFIDKAIEERQESGLTEETETIIKQLLEDKTAPEIYTVTFRYQEKVFATQQVTAGECATVPLLLPAATGSWNYDFTKPINEDTIIDWIE